MEALVNISVGLSLLVGGAVIGYRFCMYRNMVPQVLEMMELQTKHIMGELSVEEYQERIKKLKE